MKNIPILLAVIVLCCAAPAWSQDWMMKNGRTWTRTPDSMTRSDEKAEDRGGKEIIKLIHTGQQDWALSEGKRIAVKPGEIVELAADMKLESGAAMVSVVTRTKDGNEISWSYGQKEMRGAQPWRTVVSKFIVPQDAETIEPRIIGYGPTMVMIDGFSLTKVGYKELVTSNIKPIKLESACLDVDVDLALGVFAVTDKRTKRTWKPVGALKDFVVLPNKPGEEALFRLLHTETLFEFGVSVTLEPGIAEMEVKLDSKGPMPGNIAYPPAFGSAPGDRLVVPMNEGISYPVEAVQQGMDIRAGRLIAYGGHGICMAFWGQVEDATGAGMMAILETADDASINIERKEKELLRIGPVWEPSMKEFRYPRKLRYVFLDKGGYVGVCKRYREYAKKTGLFVPFSEKVKRNPNIDKLLGAANIWCWDWNWNANHVDWKGTKVDLVREMKSLGFDRILWSGGGSAQEIAELNKIPNVLTSRYDIYQDIMDPAQFEAVGYVHGDWTTEAWPHDINWTDPDGTWRKGWSVDQKDKTKPRIPCAVICDAQAVPYAQKRISKELKTKPFTARFIDTTVAAPWFECYHPDHPMTRSDSRKHKMKLLKLIGDLGLVCGSETGHDASVPYCDYFEGMLSLGPYRVHESGRNMIQLVDEVPPQITDFQVNPVLRLPLWELVYHDCTVAQWYWGDYNNKLPKVWRKRDLFNALYGTPPMYMFTKKNWNENKDRFVESYKTATKTARATAYAEMLDHRILSPDRLVQQTFFSNGVRMTVNFGEQTFKLADGTELGPMDWKMEQ